MKENNHPQLHVVAAVVEHEGYFLAVQRGKGKHVYTDYKWEFPGGKIEVGEQAEEALKRELTEEMDYAVCVERHLGTVEHSYPDFDIQLEFFLCHPAGDAEAFQLKEHHSSAWLLPEELTAPDWAEADLDFVAQLRTMFNENASTDSAREEDENEGKGPSNKELWMVGLLLLIMAIAYFVQHGF